MSLYGLLDEFQRRILVPRLGDKGFHHLAFVIPSAPKVMRLAMIFTKTSSRCQRQGVKARILFHQNRTVLWQMSIPRSVSRSLTLRSDRGYCTYIMTTSPTISGDEL